MENIKYALIALPGFNTSITSEGLLPVEDNLFVTSTLPFAIPDDEIVEMGERKKRRIERSNFFLVSTMPSQTPGVADAETLELWSEVRFWFHALQLVGFIKTGDKTTYIHGGRVDGTFSVRGSPCWLHPRVAKGTIPSDVTLEDLKTAAQISNTLRRVSSSDFPGYRFNRSILSYLSGNTGHDIESTFHLYMRCLDGLLCFWKGTVLGDRLHLIVPEISRNRAIYLYQIRNLIEHMNNPDIGSIDKPQIRLKGKTRREKTIELHRCTHELANIVRLMLLSILQDSKLLNLYSDDRKLQEFWSPEGQVGDEERREVWRNHQIDVLVHLIGSNR